MDHQQKLFNNHDGPYKVLNRGSKTYKIKINGKATNISIDRLKPASWKKISWNSQINKLRAMFSKLKTRLDSQ